MSKPRLNSLDRFRKRSPRLMLEEHSGCEVPAGCGGVVMRWRNPHEARPIRINMYSPVESTVWVDGERAAYGRLDLCPGRHVLAIEIGDADRTACLLMAVLQHDPAEKAREGLPHLADEPALNIRSRNDGTWRFLLEPPPPGWQGLDFDDSTWPALVERHTAKVEWPQPNSYQWHSCNSEGALGLGVPTEGISLRGRVFVRRVFDLPQPSLTAGGR
jgi:hypothetical protein